MKLLPLLAAFACAAGLAAADLAAVPGLRYTYTDEAGVPLDPARFNDPDGTFLTDGSTDTVATTVYRDAERKGLCVTFEFPMPVEVDRVGIVWMWAHNPQQWFDEAVVKAGDAPDSLREVGRFANPGGGNNVEPLSFALSRPVRARCFRVDILQHAQVGRFMLGVAGVSLEGGDADRAALEAALNASVQLSFPRHYPSNVFDIAHPVAIPVEPVLPAGARPPVYDYRLSDYFGNLVEAGRLEGGGAFEFAGLEPGYYELEVAAETLLNGEIRLTGAGKTSFMVAPLTDRSAAEALAAGARFGIQEGYSQPESLDAFALLGMPWRRGLLFFAPFAGNDPENIDWSVLDRKIAEQVAGQPAAVNMFEIKCVPEYLYDRERFGEKDGDWFLRMPRDRELYQRFIAGQVDRLPPDQVYFELWNEPWDLYTPEDFATLAQWMREAIKEVRPDAVIGPNLGPMAHLTKVIEHGGMEGMDFLAIHPYSSDFKSSPEAAELRQRIRNYRELLKSTLGRDLPLYVTEIGWPTPEGGPMANTEQQQAYYTVRACLAMYAEDIKAIMPYCTGQPETDPDEKEHYFGFVRADLTPKPVLAAYANLARQLEGAEFLGDLNLGVNVGAMLFRRPDGQRMLALFTDGASIPVFFRPDADELTVVDIMGRERTLPIVENRCSVMVTDNPVYLIGLGPGVESLIAEGAGEQWSNVYRRGEREIPFLADPSRPEAWEALPVCSIGDPGVEPDHVSGRWQAAWNDEALWINLDVHDREPGHNGFEGSEVWRGDGLEIFLSTSPETAVAGFLKEADRQLLITPYGAGDETVAVFGDVYRRGEPIAGFAADWRLRGDGWGGILKIPFAALGVRPEAGTALAMELALDDVCSDHARIQLNSNGRHDNWANSSVWSLLRLKR